jgi:NAD(P)-dependent dehydrogenase (short-subunit alcohol dehydrogenase family)/carbon monoxide dehydrogenase subunit G
MIRLQEQIEVNRTIEDCFRYISDFSTIEQWDPGVYRAEKITPGPSKVGSQFDLILNSAGRRIPMRYELKALDPLERVVLEGQGSGVHALDEILFEKLSATRTRIRYQADLSFSGPLGKADSLLRPWLKRVGIAAVSGLKRALEIENLPSYETLKDRAKDHLILPAAWDFTEAGYLALPNKGLSEFMDGRTVLITGPTSGIGLSAACEFARLGAHVILVGRDSSRLQEARQAVVDKSAVKPEQISVFEAELSLRSELERVSREILVQHPTLDVLVHNAGALFQKRECTSEGYERTFAIHLLAPLVLTESLFPALQKGHARVLFVSSGGLYTQAVHAEDLQSEKSRYDGAKVYARMKRAQLALMDHFQEKWKGKGVTFNALHPGWAATPGVARSLPAFNRLLRGKLRDSRMGADTLVWLGSAKAAESVSGGFWFDRKKRPTEVFPGTRISQADAHQLIEALQAATRN